MRRTVVTGYGIISCLGNDKQTVHESLRHGQSGIRYKEDYQEMGLRSHVAGTIDLDLSEHLNRKIRRFMGDSAGYSWLAMKQAIADAGGSYAVILPLHELADDMEERINELTEKVPAA